MSEGLVVRTQLTVGYHDFIRYCQNIVKQQKSGKNSNIRIDATCLDIDDNWNETSVTFPNSYKGVVQNCNGQLTAGACG